MSAIYVQYNKCHTEYTKNKLTSGSCLWYNDGGTVCSEIQWPSRSEMGFIMTYKIKKVRGYYRVTRSAQGNIHIYTIMAMGTTIPRITTHPITDFAQLYIANKSAGVNVIPGGVVR